MDAWVETTAAAPAGMRIADDVELGGVIAARTGRREIATTAGRSQSNTGRMP